MGATANLLVLVVSLDLESQLARIHLDQFGAHRTCLLGWLRNACVHLEAAGSVRPPGKLSLDAGTLHQDDHRWRGQPPSSPNNVGVEMSSLGHSRLFGPTLGLSGLLSTPDTYQQDLQAVSSGGEQDMKTTRS